MTQPELKEYKEQIRKSFNKSQANKKRAVEHLESIKEEYREQQMYYLSLAECYGVNIAKKIVRESLGMTQREWEEHYSAIKKVNKHTQWTLPHLKLVGVIKS